MAVSWALLKRWGVDCFSVEVVGCSAGADVSLDSIAMSWVRMVLVADLQAGFCFFRVVGCWSVVTFRWYDLLLIVVSFVIHLLVRLAYLFVGDMTVLL